MRHPHRLALAAVVLIALAGTTHAQTPAPAPLVYPPSNPAHDISSALAAAKTDNRYVLLDFGADWCPDCRVLASLMESDTVGPFLKANFHVIHVDVGRRDKNMDVAAQYEATAGAWIPALVVLDSTGRPLAVTDDAVKVTRRTPAADLLSLLQGWAPKTRLRPLTEFTEHGVHVELSLDKDSLEHVWLSATYTPTDPESYVYSKDLPAAGISDLGRPTVLAVVTPSGVKVIGPIVANRVVRADRIDALNVTLPEYPVGPVTLRMPIELPPAGASSRVALSIGYMTCGPKGCLPPVEDKRVTVTVR
jgi:thioredoxin 1